MPGGLALLSQDDFSGGMFQSVDVQKIPSNGAYDIVNGLLDVSDGVIYRRGGSSYKGTAAAASLLSITDVNLIAGRRTVMTTSASLIDLASDDSTPETIITTGSWEARRAAVVDGVLAYPQSFGSTPTAMLFAGSRKTAASTYSTGTASVAADGVTVTGVGTTWSTNADVGAYFGVGTTFGWIAAVNSNTSLTLAYPWQGPTASGAAYFIGNAVQTSPWLALQGGTEAPYVAGVASRLAVGFKSRIAFTPIYNLYATSQTDYHALSDGGVVTGLQSLGQSLLVFATTGVYRIDNMALDLTDAAGNPQQTMRLVSGDIVLWHDNGVAGFRGAVIVPAIDDVYLMDGASSPVPIGSAIQDLYRSYVEAGYTLGLAAVSNGHYVLPVLNGTTWVDTLVCNLATRAWTRQAGFSGSCVGFATRVGSSGSRTQTLFGIRGTRIVDCTGWFAPVAANKNEADSSTHEFSVTTRDYTLSSLKGFVKKARLWIEGVDAGTDNPTVTLSSAQALPGSSFTSLGSTSAESTGDAALPSWTVNAGGKRVRFKISSTSPFASLKIKALDLFVRPRGRM